MKSKFLLFAFLILFFVSLNVHSQTTYELSVPFTDGFIGVKGSNSQQANTIKTYATLGIAKTFFMQNSAAAGAFTVQGNDVPGILRLQLNSGQLIDIPGAIVWKDKTGVVDYLGFIPAASFSSVSFSYGASLTYTIYGTTTTSNIGMGFVGGSAADFVDGTDITGNASGFADDLNNYLTATNLPANQPDGPVTVTALTTVNTTPTITGTVTLASGESLSVTVYNVLYTTANGLSIISGSWSLPISSALALGTYSVVAKITNSAGYTLNDANTNELTIGAVVPKKFITRAGQQPDDISFHVNRYGEIGVSSLTSSGEEFFYVPKHSGAAILVSSTETTANVTSTIATTGGKSITERGVCWSTTANPTTADNKTSDGPGKGIFNSAITGLTKETTYYIRTYATDDLGTSYGIEMSFTTPKLLIVGDSYQGGTIFYLGASGGDGTQHGLIRTGIHATNVSYNTVVSTTIPAANTAVLNGYSDWRLPSFIEAQRICQAGAGFGMMMSSTVTGYAPSNIEIVWSNACGNSNLSKTYAAADFKVVLVRSF